MSKICIDRLGDDLSQLHVAFENSGPLQYLGAPTLTVVYNEDEVGFIEPRFGDTYDTLLCKISSLVEKELGVDIRSFHNEKLKNSDYFAQIKKKRIFMHIRGKGIDKNVVVDKAFISSTNEIEIFINDENIDQIINDLNGIPDKDTVFSVFFEDIKKNKHDAVETNNKLKLLMYVTDPNGCTPLHTALARGFFEMVKLLIKKGACVDGKLNTGETPLMFFAKFSTSIKQKTIDILNYLLRKGADTEALDNEGYTALMIAVRCNNVAMVNFLLRKGADIEAQDREGKTVLMLAVLYSDNEEMVQLLLNNTADVNKTDNKGKNVLFWALVKKNEKMVKLLLRKGTKINKNDFGGLIVKILHNYI